MIHLPRIAKLHLASIFLAVTILLVIVMSSVSMAYILSQANDYKIDSVYLGILGFLGVSCATVYLSLNYWKECLLIFFIFFNCGFISKAYLEPVSDQLDHLYRTQERCENVIKEERLNSGLWQYSMNGLFVCRANNSTPSTILRSIDALHALYTALGSVILFVIARQSGLPPRWAFLSLCMCLFFFGTNRFSYFKYYSYGHSFTSIFIYWLWIGFFFFKKSSLNIITGIIAAALLLPIISVNHLQEAVFLAYLVLFWFILNMTEWIKSRKKHSLLFYWFVVLFLMFFVFPQLKSFQDLLSHLFMDDLWNKNQAVVYRWHDLHLAGRIWDPQYRVTETIGIMGLIALSISPLMLIWKQKEFPLPMRIRPVLLGVLPFLVFCTPLMHYIWMANVRITVYYRIAYSSLFWCTIAFFLYMIETWINSRRIHEAQA